MAAILAFLKRIIMAIHNIIVKVTNSGGGSVTGGGTINVVDPPVIQSVTATPDPAPAGTLRTITINATDPAGLALSYTCTVDGIADPAVTGHPNQFTVTV
jgi:hypothetical protein